MPNKKFNITRSLFRRANARRLTWRYVIILWKNIKNMCTKVPVSELVQLPITWVRGNDERLKTVFKSLKSGTVSSNPLGY